MRLAKPSVEILSEVILSMAKIRNSNPKQSGDGYERLVGDKDMAIRQYMDKMNKALKNVK